MSDESQVESGSDDAPQRRFGALEGVFVPTALTILGVILFLRTGWLVRQIGLGGALLAITLAFVISATTALSLSSLVTNMQVGAGGAFSILTNTLGIQLGGSVGVPLYLSQTLVVAMYIFGFREGWLTIFAHHPAWAVDLGVFAVLFVVALVSARLAFRLQFVVLAVLAAALVSLFAALGDFQMPALDVRLDDPASEVGFWAGFAVFFPAATGILAGANMSGELTEPDRAIPRGTLGAIGVTYVIYVLVAVVLAGLASPGRLATDERRGSRASTSTSPSGPPTRGSPGLPTAHWC